MRKLWKKYKIIIPLQEYLLFSYFSKTIVFFLKFENYMKEAIYEYEDICEDTGMYRYKLLTVHKRKKK